MSQHRSINQKLARAKSKEAKQQTLENWVKDWEKEQSILLDKLGKAIASDDFNNSCIFLGELKTVQKKITALPTILTTLLNSQD